MRGSSIVGAVAIVVVGCSTTFYPVDNGDASGSGDDAATPDEGPAPGVGVAFDGVDDTLPSTKALARGASAAFTAEQWFRPQGSGAEAMQLLAIHNATDRDVQMAARADGKFSCTLFDQTGVSHETVGATAASVGMWFHVACTYDGATQRLFVNGALEGSVAWTGQVLLDDFVIVAGHGDLDELRLSSVARYTAAFTPPRHVQKDADAVMMWLLDEGAGIMSVDGTGSGFDATLGLNARSPAWTAFER